MSDIVCIHTEITVYFGKECHKKQNNIIVVNQIVRHFIFVTLMVLKEKLKSMVLSR